MTADLQIFRKLDGLADEIQKSQPPVDFWRKFIYCTSLTGPILGSVDHMQPQGLFIITGLIALGMQLQLVLFN